MEKNDTKNDTKKWHKKVTKKKVAKKQKNTKTVVDSNCMRHSTYNKVITVLFFLELKY